MRPLRFAVLWVLAGAALFLVTLYWCLRAPGIEENWFEGFDKLAHGLSFFALTFWGLALVERRAYGRVVVVMLAVGGGIEVAQQLMALGRQAESGDLLADGLGTLFALLASLVRRESWFEWLEARVS